MENRYTDSAYLQQGNARQRAAFALLQKLGLFAALSKYDPILVGTIPLDIDIASSDLDIICEVHNHALFVQRIEHLYGNQAAFSVARQPIGGLETVCVSFQVDGFMLEIFGQPQPVLLQNGYLHLLIEARLLALEGEPLRREIRRLKELGLKTEPAFATYLGLEGDPFAALLQLSAASDQELQQLLAESRGKL